MSNEATQTLRLLLRWKFPAMGVGTRVRDFAHRPFFDRLEELKSNHDDGVALRADLADLKNVTPKLVACLKSEMQLPVEPLFEFVRAAETAIYALNHFEHPDLGELMGAYAAADQVVKAAREMLGSEESTEAKPKKSNVKKRTGGRRRDELSEDEKAAARAFEANPGLDLKSIKAKARLKLSIPALESLKERFRGQNRRSAKTSVKGI